MDKEAKFSNFLKLWMIRIRDISTEYNACLTTNIVSKKHVMRAAARPKLYVEPELREAQYI